MTSIFTYLFALSAVVLVCCGILGILAPAINDDIEVPTAPTWPNWASGLDWTVSITDWSGIGSFFVLIGGGIVWLFSWIAFIGSMVGVAFTLLGLVPIVANGVAALLFILFGGSLILLFRGGGGEK